VIDIHHKDIRLARNRVLQTVETYEYK
jgi:hypothetical protein